jgi:hypothetical protein
MDATRTSQATIVASSNHRLNPFSVHRKRDGFPSPCRLLLADILTVAKAGAVGARQTLPSMAAPGSNIHAYAAPHVRVDIDFPT